MDAQLSFEDNLKLILQHESVNNEIKTLANKFISNYYEKGDIG